MYSPTALSWVLAALAAALIGFAKTGILGAGLLVLAAGGAPAGRLTPGTRL